MDEVNNGWNNKGQFSQWIGEWIGKFLTWVLVTLAEMEVGWGSTVPGLGDIWGTWRDLGEGGYTQADVSLRVLVGTRVVPWIGTMAHSWTMSGWDSGNLERSCPIKRDSHRESRQTDFSETENKGCHVKPCLKAKFLLATCFWFLLEQSRLESTLEVLGMCSGSENVAQMHLFYGEEFTWSKPIWVAWMGASLSAQFSSYLF